MNFYPLRNFCFVVKVLFVEDENDEGGGGGGRGEWFIFLSDYEFYHFH